MHALRIIGLPFFVGGNINGVHPEAVKLEFGDISRGLRNALTQSMGFAFRVQQQTRLTII